MMLRPISRDTAEWPSFIIALAGASLPASDLADAGQQRHPHVPPFGGPLI
jgi:hypothetical protein